MSPLAIVTEEHTEAASGTAQSPSEAFPVDLLAWARELGLADKPVITVEEALPLLGLSERSLRELIRQDRFPHVRAGRRVLIPVPGLLAWLAGRR